MAKVTMVLPSLVQRREALKKITTQKYFNG
jgi:hypothetical protein